MNTLEGNYKSNFENFSLRIETKVNSKQKNEFEFRLINPDNSEEFLYKEEMRLFTNSSEISVIGKNVKISCSTDFSIISVIDFPRLGYKGNYTRIS